MIIRQQTAMYGAIQQHQVSLTLLLESHQQHNPRAQMNITHNATQGIYVAIICCPVMYSLYMPSVRTSSQYLGVL